MFNTKVEKTARRLRKETKGKVDVLSLVNYALEIGYKVVFFNTPEGDRLIELYDLEYAVKTTSAFTLSGNDNIIFIDSNAHTHDRIYLLLHEIGHIVLGHIGDGNISLKDRPFLEAEADAFVHEVMNPRKRNIALHLIILFIVVVFGFSGGFMTQRKIPENTHNIADNVIITRNGEAYHREGCMTIKDKEYIFVPRSEAKKLFEPCGVCNP